MKKCFALALGLFAVALRLWAWLKGRFTVGAEGAPVLILEPFGMGDVISLEPLVRELRGKGRDVCVCARPEWRVLFPAPARWVEACIPWGNHDSRRKYRLADYLSAGFVSFFKELRKAGRGTVGVDTRGDIRSVVLLYAAGCRCVITSSHYLGTELQVLPLAARRVDFAWDLRRWEFNLEFLSALGLSGTRDSVPPRFPHLKTQAYAGQPRRLGLIPVAPWRGKWWGRGQWAAMIEAAQGLGWEVVSLCGPGQVPLVGEQVDERVAIIECASVLNWADQLQRCSLVVGVDTGPMHLADALEVPLVALFGQGLLPLWAPSGKKSCLLSRHSDPDFALCLPLDENAAVGQKFMQRIRVADVLEAMRRLVPPA